MTSPGAPGSPSPSLSEYLYSTRPEWSDEARILGMFAAFASSRDINPEAWDARLSFWRSVILDVLPRSMLDESSLVIDPSRLSSKFVRHGLTPLGMGRVLEEMEKRGELTPLSQYEAVANKSHATWSSMAWKILSKLWIYGEQEEPPQEALVCVPLLKRLCEELVQYYHSRSSKHPDSLLDHQEFVDLLAAVRKGLPPLCKGDVSLVFDYMRRQRLISTCDEHGKEPAHIEASLIKFKASHEKAAIPITDAQRNIARIRKISDRLKSQIAFLSSQIAEIRTLVGQTVKTDRSLALYHLKRSKLLEKIQEERMGSSVSLEAVLLKIDAAQGDKQTIEAYRVGTATLKSINADTTARDVEEILDSLQEAMAEKEEISQVLATQIKMDSLLEEEAEDELAQMIAEQIENVAVPTLPTDAQLLDGQLRGLAISDNGTRKSAEDSRIDHKYYLADAQ